MAKRKAASRRRRTTPKPARRAASRSARRKSASRKRATKKRAAPRAAARKASRKKALRGARRVTSKAAASRKGARSSSAARPKRTVKRVVAKSPAKAAQAKRSSPARPKAAPSLPKRRIPGLDRERRAITEKDEFVLTPPSSLNLDRTASAARSGRRELQERYEKHTETSPALTGGDVDADWESAYSVGDEAPGGDNPTPDQDIVDDIGRAVGVEYQDNEELKGEKKLLERDKHRWELDPASAEDYEDR